MEIEITIKFKKVLGAENLTFSISHPVLDKKIKSHQPQTEKEYLDAVKKIIEEGIERDYFLGRIYEGVNDEGEVVISGNLRYLKSRGYDHCNISSNISGRLPHYKKLHWRLTTEKF